MDTCAYTDSITNHIIQRITESSILHEPYPHMVIDDFFPRDFLIKIDTLFPTTEDSEFEIRNRKVKPKRHVRSFFSSNKNSIENILCNVLNDKLLECLLAKYGIANQGCQWYGDCVWDYNNEGKNALDPHPDDPSKIISCVFYVPEIKIINGRREIQDIPGTDILTQNDDGTFNEVCTIQAKRNRCFTFLRSDSSWHAVKETKQPRRTITMFIVKGDSYLLKHK